MSKEENSITDFPEVTLEEVDEVKKVLRKDGPLKTERIVEKTSLEDKNNVQKVMRYLRYNNNACYNLDRQCELTEDL